MTYPLQAFAFTGATGAPGTVYGYIIVDANDVLAVAQAEHQQGAQRVFASERKFHGAQFRIYTAIIKILLEPAKSIDVNPICKGC